MTLLKKIPGTPESSCPWLELGTLGAMKVTLYWCEDCGATYTTGSTDVANPLYQWDNFRCPDQGKVI